MPDLLTHSLAAYLAGSRVKSIRCVELFLVGTILPDVLTRLPAIVWGGLYWFTLPLHTPLVLILVCSLLSLMFPWQIRRTVWILLISGATFHMFLDVLQKSVPGWTGYYWSFPVFWKGSLVGLFYSEYSLFVIPVLLGLWLVSHIFGSVKREGPGDHRMGDAAYERADRRGDLQLWRP